jgi:hypothetical protein
MQLRMMILVIFLQMNLIWMMMKLVVLKSIKKIDSKVANKMGFDGKGLGGKWVRHPKSHRVMSKAKK